MDPAATTCHWLCIIQFCSAWETDLWSPTLTHPRNARVLTCIDLNVWGSTWCMSEKRSHCRRYIFLSSHLIEFFNLFSGLELEKSIEKNWQVEHVPLGTFACKIPSEITVLKSPTCVCITRSTSISWDTNHRKWWFDSNFGAMLMWETNINTFASYDARIQHGYDRDMPWIRQWHRFYT